MPIIKFFKKILGRKSSPAESNLEEVSILRHEHHLSKTEISENALRVINHLNHHGYQAYLVGGSVRDLLLRKVPKDFDVVTNATPQQIKKLFRNARIIGRRFKLVHITYHREIIEVSTFRSNLPDKDLMTNDHGMVIRDNVYGTLEQDAWRRDFSINSLYYDARNGSIVDYTHGFDDIKNHQIRIIGEALQRYQEDPVRMLRALRFAAKLNFGMEKATEAAIYQTNHLIAQVSNARLYDELSKLWQCQASLAAFKLLIKFDFFAKLFPITAKSVEHQSSRLEFIHQALENTDQRLKADKPTTPAFIYAVLLWFPMRDRAKELEKSQELHPLLALETAIGQILNEQCRIIGIPRRFTQIIREIWLLQYRLNKRVGMKPILLMQHPRFRAAYDFLILRIAAQDEIKELGDWWTKFQTLEQDAQMQLIAEQSPPTKKKRRKRKPKKDHESQQSN
jgi:poly(A) polymerase